LSFIKVSLKYTSSPSKNPAKYLVVVLHGWGDNFYGLMPLAEHLEFPDIEFIFADAPYPHPHVPDGKAWYHLETPEYKGLKESSQSLFNWILSLEQSTGVPLSHTMLIGFSQGGAMTLDVGLKLPLLGLCSLSGYLHYQPSQLNLPSPPLLLIHGSQDVVVPVSAAQYANTLLKSLGVEVDYHELNIGHEISLEALNLLREFINKRSKAISHLE